MDACFQPVVAPGFRIPTWMQDVATRALVPCYRYGGLRGEQVFGILTYHRVTPPLPGLPPPTFNVAPAQLHRQLSGLRRRGFEPWPLSRVLDHARKGLPVPRTAFVVTFDDGYANNVTQALPILQELRVPATIFLATAYLDNASPFPFDNWSAAGTAGAAREAWIPLTRSQCHAALASGLIELGSHTHTHQVFRGRPQPFRNDLETCVALLRNEFGIERPTFSFPYGIADSALTDVTRNSGVACGLRTTRRLADVCGDPFTWGRFNVSARDTADMLAVKLGGWFDALRTAARGTRRSAAACTAPTSLVDVPS